MSYAKKLRDLPEVVVIEPNQDVMVGTWHFNIQEELDQPEDAHWRDARAMISFAAYMDALRKEGSIEEE